MTDVDTDISVARATVHGYAVASWWAAGSLLTAAVVPGVLIDADPRADTARADQAAAAETARQGS
jgi:hypothetical protein